MTTDSSQAPSRARRLPSGRHGLSRRYVESNQRSRILEATIQATAELGYAVTLVDDIIRRAGVSRRTFYERFPNRQAAFLAAYDAVADKLFAAVQEAATGAATFEERIVAGFTAFVRHLADAPAVARVCVVEALAAGPEAAARRIAVMRAFARIIDESARSLPHYDTLPAMTANAVVGSAYDAIYRLLRSEEDADLTALLPDLVEIALLPYVGAAAAGEHGRRLRGGN
jgi:AcrR family transcriptional regulator